MAEERARLGIAQEALGPAPQPAEPEGPGGGLFRADDLERVAGVLAVMEQAGFAPRRERVG